MVKIQVFEFENLYNRQNPILVEAESFLHAMSYFAFATALREQDYLMSESQLIRTDLRENLIDFAIKNGLRAELEIASRNYIISVIRELVETKCLEDVKKIFEQKSEI